MMVTEFYWSSPKDSGMSSRQDLSTQQERGLACRNYVEQSAVTNYVLGIEWFTLVDQATTCRWFSGLISVADRPWKPIVTEMAKTNAYIYKVRMHKFINDPTNNVYFLCYFDVQAGDGHHQLSNGLNGTETNEFPLSAACFLELFGGKKALLLNIT